MSGTIRSKLDEIGEMLQKKFNLPFTGSSISTIVEVDSEGFADQEEERKYIDSILGDRMIDFLEEYVLPQNGMQEGWFYTCLPVGAFPLFNKVRVVQGLQPLQDNLIWKGPLNPSYYGNEWELHSHWEPGRHA